MDYGVTMHNTDSLMLDKFLHAVRRHIWSTDLLNAARRSIWSASFLLLALAAVHILIAPISIGWILLCVITPALVILTPALLRRPTLTACATRADKAFRGHALMTTAVECLHKTTAASGFAKRTVLLQAEDAARSWYPGVAKQFPQRPAVATVLATIPLFVALVVLSSPGAEEKIALVAEVTKDTPLVPGDDAKGIERNDVATLRRIIADETFADERPTDDQERPAPSKTFAPSQENAASTGTELSAMPDPIDQAASVAGLSEDDSGLPGDSAAASTPSGRTFLSATQFEDREIIELQRSGSNISAGAAIVATYSSSKHPALNYPNVIRAAAAPDTLQQWTNLSRAQAAHARLYLDKSGKTDD